MDETRPSISEWLENSRRERAELEALLAMGDGTTPYARSATTSEVADILWPGHELGTCIYDSSTGGGCGIGKWGLAIVGVIPGSKVLLPARAGATVFKTAHYATRLERAGVNVARAESEVAIAIGAMRPNMAESALVSGRMTVDGVLVEYRAMLLPNGTVNVGTIFPVAP